MNVENFKSSFSVRELGPRHGDYGPLTNCPACKQSVQTVWSLRSRVLQLRYEKHNNPVHRSVCARSSKKVVD